MKVFSNKPLWAFLRWLMVTTLVIIQWALGILIVSLFIIWILTGNEESAMRKPSKASLSYVMESCVELSDKFGLRTKLSDIQRKELWKNYEGKAFEWVLKVEQISEVDDGFSVRFKCENSNAFYSDMIMTYPQNAKDMLLQMNREASYKIKGLLKNYSVVYGLSAVSL